MEHTEDRITMLHRIPSPAFFVDNGIITDSNVPAQQHLIESGNDIRPLLATGQEEYSQFQEGCLYLTIRIDDALYSASVSAVGASHLFVLEQAADEAELQSMALAAQALRGPLTNVMSVADQLFPLTSDESSEQAQEQIARINRGLYQMMRIICNMSDAYRYSKEQISRTEVRNISALIRELFDRITPLAESTGISVRYSGPQEMIFGVVDAEKLERAISNMISNAIKFTPAGGSINAHLVQKRKMLYLTIQDTGSGISDSVAGNLYNRYQRQPGLEDSRFGLGLGMVIIRSAATAHGGTVLTQRGQDFGLRLTMTIPIRQTTDSMVRSPMILVDYAGEWDHLLLEFSDCLSPELYFPK